VVSNGVPSLIGVTTYVNAMYPAAYRTTIIDGINACIKLSGTGLVKTDECKSYKPFSKCILKVLKMTCKTPKGAGAVSDELGVSPSPSPSGRRRRDVNDSSSEEDE